MLMITMIKKFFMVEIKINKTMIKNIKRKSKNSKKKCCPMKI